MHIFQCSPKAKCKCSLNKLPSRLLMVDTVILLLAPSLHEVEPIMTYISEKEVTLAWYGLIGFLKPFHLLGSQIPSYLEEVKFLHQLTFCPSAIRKWPVYRMVKWVSPSYQPSTTILWIQLSMILSLAISLEPNTTTKKTLTPCFEHAALVGSNGPYKRYVLE